MESLCTRCAHLRLRVGSQVGGRAYTGLRSFTATCTFRDDGSSSAGQSTSGAPKREGQPRRQPQQPPIRQQPVISSDRTSGPQVLRRTGPPQQGQMLRRTGGPPSAGGQRLGRSGPSPSGPGLLRRTAAPGRPGAGGRGPSGAPQGKKQDPRRRRQRQSARPDDESAEDRATLREEMDKYIQTYVDPPENSTKHLPYTPANLTLADLKPDWPDTPISSSGLSESVLHKIQWLAQRFPHGYQSPRSLAEHFLKGGLTRFESEDEKAEVLKVAAELKDELAAVEPRKHDAPLPIASDAGFQNILTKGDERAFLVDGIVKGAVGDLEKQKYPFLDNVASGLRNNETYGEVQTAKFMDTITKLIPQQSTGKGTKKSKKAA